ncbi:hypothetical protein [Mitsuokella sp. oral taxon 131]|uniref:hypothetical protein n=1 Tax=Mitsuokella sp. oral taxon 131 TaxID=1321780 RepID=UPI0003AD7EBA|nr:hypothetical protein [Mitsuokella sp. oral taxon 131]ERL04274.1 hypothetical protein HMPREF1985_01503 [Mitsuokella sp. oral taxon 131 str. W9106]
MRVDANASLRELTPSRFSAYRPLVKRTSFGRDNRTGENREGVLTLAPLWLAYGRRATASRAGRATAALHPMRA